MPADITNTDDLIDSRDVIQRIDDLETELREEFDTRHADRDTDMIDFDNWLVTLAHDTSPMPDPFMHHADELLELRELAAQADGYTADWTHGATLIRDSYFETYAQELAEDIGAIKREMQWPYTCIDWAQAARELQHDYTAVEFDGVTYWVR